jgi:hypothetical protein
MVGGRAAYKTGRKGSLAWSLQYINDRPALCIWRPLDATRRVYAIPMESMHAYVTNGGNLNIEYCVTEAMNEIPRMGFGDAGKAKSAVHEFVDIIAERLEDMLKMRPRADNADDTLREKQHVATMEVKDSASGRIIMESKIIE